MSTFDYSFENFQRLEDFPLYTSFIRSFGKPIIPPLLTPQERIKISNLRASMVQEKQNSKNPRRSSGFSKKQKETDGISCAGQLFRPQNNVFITPNEFCKQQISALSPSNLKKFNERSSSSEMLVSISKIPCSGVCSTVHDSVIVFPNEIKRSYNENISTEPETGDSNSEYGESYSENGCDCDACQNKFPEIDVPYKNALGEQINSVSEDERESVAEEAEFGSLPTVIYNKKIVTQDTDSESIVTCMTQSTDLDKYMDCFIEYSSPDDPAVISQSSNRASVSSRSDDASTETIINTEHELTPCTSATAELNHSVERSSATADVSRNAFSSANPSDPNINNRACSVDSYMKILRTCARNLYLKKSQSEPSQPDISHLQNTLLSSKAPTNEIKEFVGDANFNTQLSKESNDVKVPDADVPLSSGTTFISDSELKLGDTFQKSHIRRNSYTLLHPSSALIMAHADCQCQGDPSVDVSPHSCSSENASLNSAFKKEIIDLILPPTADRERMFPVLNYEHLSKDFDDRVSVSGSETISSLVNGTDEDSCDCEPRSVKSDSASSVAELLNADLTENPPSPEEEHSVVESVKNQNLRKFDENSVIQENLLKHRDGSILTELIEELKENHQSRVNQLMEEQNKQWLKLQEEFKDQERMLFEKLKSCGISVPSGNSSVEHSSFSNTDFESSDINEQISMSTAGTNKLTSSDSNSTSLSSGTETFPTVIQNDLDKSNPPEIPCHDAKYENSEVTSAVPWSEKTVAEADASQQLIVTGKSIDLTGLFSSVNSCDVPCAYEQYESEHIPVDDSNSSFGFQISNDMEQHELKIPTCSAQNYTDFKRKIPATSFIRNNISYTNGPIQNSAPRNVPMEENNPSAKLTNQVLPSKQANEMTGKIQTSKHSGAHCSKPKSYNLNSENRNLKSNFGKQADQPQTSTIVIEEKSNYPMKQDITLCNKNFKRSDAIDRSLPSTSGFHDAKGFSGFGVHHKVQTVKNQQVLQKPFAMPNSPPNTAKLTFSSLTNLKRRPCKDLKNPDILKRFEKLPAFVKGYLTRRLLKTERILGLIKTAEETAVLIQNLDAEQISKGGLISERDVQLRNLLLSQLLTTHSEMYNIMCTISTKERMKIIAESRNSRLNKKKAEKLQDTSSTSMNLDRPVSVPAQKPELSSATVKSLQRKKRRSGIDSRTYTIEDLKECRRRSRSSSSLKSHSTSPASIYQGSVGVNLKRKTKSLVKPTQTQHWK